ncbi:3-phosphoserine/phosphohydroxythreonine transaminase [Feifania hominis]|uniref:Phosphoserine aminotransferase n=1 Tax=Feifania hominis TaxID=2763660 RepID=A0A926DDL9_9FIRM|nr:3-phosphoserine/phosphohydroxythreonine transaminase [Feifania hominis]MBC8536158.1 3-phosphoserine/phosphohydroxythreonine transaminase [Feifania hominis]
MNRVYNFSSGPSVLPLKVLERAQAEFLDYGNSGMSVMEMSHRSPGFDEIICAAEQLLRELMGIPDNYRVLFLQGGASTQFAAIPLNFLTGSKKAQFVLTGLWAKKAHAESAKYGDCEVVASSADKTFSYIPAVGPDMVKPDSDYFYICHNNTIYGTTWHTLPETGDVPLFADVSSSILSERMDVSRFGLLFAGAQKNMGPAGLTVVIVRDDLLGHKMDICPTMLDYKLQADNRSLYNTPPTYSIYICRLVLEWLKSIGGIEAIEQTNRKKAALLYDYLDSSKLFRGTVAEQDRSIMNIPFVTGDEELDRTFVSGAKAAGLVNLAGHRTVGGMRASIYNAMPVEGVEALIQFMYKFEKEYHKS